MPSMIPFRPAPFAVTTDYEGNPIRAGGDSFGLHEDVTRVNAGMAGPSRWNSGMRNDANIGLAREMDPLLKGEDLTGQE